MFRKVAILTFLVLGILSFSITFEEYEKQNNYEYTGNFFDGTNVLVTHVFENKSYDIMAWNTSDLDNIIPIYEGGGFLDYSVSKDGLKFTSINKNGMVIVYDSESDLNYIILKKSSKVYFHPDGEMIIAKVVKGDKSEFHFVDFKNNEDEIIVKYRENSIPFSKDAKMHVFNNTFIISDFKGNQDGNKYYNNYIREFSKPLKNSLKFETSFDQIFFSIDKDWIYHYDNRLDAVSTNKIFLPEEAFSRINLGNIGKLLYPDLAYIDSQKDSRVKKYFALKHQLKDVNTGEYLLYNNKFILVNEIDIPNNLNVYGFDREKSIHIYFTEGEVVTVNSFNMELKKYIDPYFKNLELLNIGFENVIEDIIETINIKGMEFLAYNEDRFFGDEFNLSYYNKTKLILEELKALVTKESTTKSDFNYIYKKIIQYSLLANYTNNYEEAEKAVDYLKGLKSNFNYLINWDKLNKNLVLIEALTIANKKNTKEAYYFILDKEGFLYENENFLESYIEDYPEMFRELLKDKKKLSYFSGIAEEKLSSLEKSYSSDKDIIDEKKEIYSFSEFLKSLEININDLM